MIKIAIVDDDGQSRRTLEENLKKYETEENTSFSVTHYSDSEYFLRDYVKQYDIIFLDVEMPVLNGIEVAKRLRQTDSSVIIVFVTNFGKYAIDGYEVEALDFIVKPVTYYGLKLKIKRAVERLAKDNDATIEVSSYDRITRIRQKDVYYVEVREHGLFINTVDGIVQSYGSLKKLEATLDKTTFSRCNHCYLVNLGHVKVIKGFELTLDNGEVLQISRSKKKPFSEAVDKFAGSTF